MTLSRKQLKRLGDLHTEIASIYYAEASNEFKEETESPVVEEPKKDNVVELPVNTKTVDTEVVVEKEDKEAMDLENLSYNELKKLAKELGLSAKGTKSELVIRIQEAQGIVVADDEEDELEEVTPDVPVLNEDEETEEVEELVEEEDLEAEDLPKTLHEEIMEQLEDYTTDELKEILESINKPTKGKRQTLLALIVQAIEDGELDFGDDEESEEEEDQVEEDNSIEEVETESDEEEEEDTDEIDEDEEDEDEESIDLEDILKDLDRNQVKSICRKLDIKVLKKDTADTLKAKVEDFEDSDALMNALMELGFIEGVDEEEEEDEIESVEPNYTGSKARISAMKKIYKNTLEELEEGDITPKQVKALLDKYHNGTWKGTKEENNLEYARIIAELVDDDGDQVDLAEAYSVGDNFYCCGTELKELDDELYCEHCGTAYDCDTSDEE